MKTMVSAVIVFALLAACDQAPQDGQAQNGVQQPEQQLAPAPQQGLGSSEASHAHVQWKGTWHGGEGTYVEITPASPGNYEIEMQYDLENLVRVNGIDDGDGIAFTRDGETFKLRGSHGDEIGLRATDGQANCLKVQDGEGYCR